jgi:predicted O-methyltransferase YrrM
MMDLIPGEWRYYDYVLEMPFPWYTKPCLLHLCRLKLGGKRVFEYGVGDSTFWWRAKGCEVLGVDDNEEWANKANMMHRSTSGSYINAVWAHEEKSIFDIIVIDGAYRDYCLSACWNALSEDGFVIIDNYLQPSVDQAWYFTPKFIKENNLKVELFKEPNHYDWQTAIVRR